MTNGRTEDKGSPLGEKFSPNGEFPPTERGIEPGIGSIPRRLMDSKISL